jgi:2-polyprenyl-3-methyl-5-hydroxy-6-metoxy-1,4-benzoquinol methylase
MKRDFAPDQPELMDVPQPVTPELERDLANLASLNRYFGSHALIRRFLELWLEPSRNYRILDMATGAGDVPRLMVDWAREHNVKLHITAIDAAKSTLEIARAQSAAYPEIEWICADALTYRGQGTYDLVCCSLALHHFSEEDAIQLLRKCRELSHRFVLVADLERTLAAMVGVWAVTQFIYRDHMTRYDGRLSVRRAFSYTEFRALAEAAGWRDFEQSRFVFYRQAIWMTGRDLGDITVPVVEAVEPLPCPV